MLNILVTAISFYNYREGREKSEIYSTFAKRLINDVLSKTPWDIRVSTNRNDLFEEVQNISRVEIKKENMNNHKTHVGAFNQLLKFFAIKNINSKYDYVLYLDCDTGISETIDVEQVEKKIKEWEQEGFEMMALRTNATYEESEIEFKKTVDLNEYPKPLFNNKFSFYGLHDEWRGSKFPSEHVFLVKNNQKLKNMAENLENFCFKFETQDETHPTTFDMEAFEIGVSAHLAGINMGDMRHDATKVFKVLFNGNNWEKIKI